MLDIKTIKLIVIGGLIIAYLLLLWRVDNLTSKNTTLKNSLKTANNTILKHEENILITERVSNDLQNSLNSVNARYDRLRKQPVQCHAITSDSSGGDVSSLSERLPEGNGVRSDWARLYARRAETDARRLIGCQDLIRQTWEVNK